MKIIAIGFGIVLILLGIIGGTLGIAFLGLLMVVLGAIQGKWSHNNPLYGTVMVAILALLGSLRGVYFLIRNGESTQLNIVQTIVLVLSVIYIGLGLNLIPNFWVGWKEFGQFLGDWLARVVLTIFYFTVMVPFGIGVRLLSDPLMVNSTPDELWRPRVTGDQKKEEVMRQF